MRVAEHEIIKEQNGRRRPTAYLNSFSRKKEVRDRAFWVVVWFFGLLGFSLAINGILFFKGKLAKDWKDNIRDFSMLVLVQGSLVEVDEVGRFLKQWEGVQDVSFISSEAALQELKADPLLADLSHLMDVASLPSAWRVRWAEGALAPSQLERMVQEARQMGSVQEVSFDERLLGQLNQARLRHLQVETLSSTLMLMAVTLFVVLLGRALFFTSFAHFHPQKFIQLAAFDVIVWMGGFLSVKFILGSLSWRWAGLAFLAAGIHYLWSAGSRDHLKA